MEELKEIAKQLKIKNKLKVIELRIKFNYSDDYLKEEIDKIENTLK